MPSVHIGVTYLIVRAARNLGRMVFSVAAVYGLVMLWAVISGGEHYVIDAIAGLCWQTCARDQ